MIITKEKTLKSKKFKNLYAVTAFGKNSYIECISNFKLVTHIRSNSAINGCKKLMHKKGKDCTLLFLGDFNINGSNNNHYLFSKKKEAEKYMNYCIKNNRDDAKYECLYDEIIEWLNK